ncbi:MAG: iron ABC transporter permease [Synergistaceae bacterium]|jgi:iron complex transport system permease protein|nr:iron ABC transporter permease [Synergistaceae bacterium]
MKVPYVLPSRVLLFLLPFFTAFVCIGIGRYSISMADSFAVLWGGLTGDTDGISSQAYRVIFSIRLPRILLSVLCGGGLAVSGTAFQALFTNPLATPDTLGVASGASFGAAFALLLGFPLLGVQAAALLFGLMAMFLSYSISRIRGKSTIIMVVLSGLIVSSMFNAFVSLIKYVADPENQLPSITYWLMGSFASVTYRGLSIGAPLIIAGVSVISALRWKLNILSLNEDEARSVGVHVKATRLAVISAATLVTGSTVAMCGQVGWVGLLIPHICRMIFGSNNMYLVPASVSLGAVFMIVIDTIARAATAAEIPASILTATVGAPFFVLLLRKTGGAWL